MKKLVTNLKEYKIYEHLIKVIRGLSGVVAAVSSLTILTSFLDTSYSYDQFISGFFFGSIFVLSIGFIWFTRNNIKDAKMSYREYLEKKELKNYE